MWNRNYYFSKIHEYVIVMWNRNYYFSKIHEYVIIMWNMNYYFSKIREYVIVLLTKFWRIAILINISHETQES